MRRAVGYLASRSRMLAAYTVAIVGGFFLLEGVEEVYAPAKLILIGIILIVWAALGIDVDKRRP